jgi:hypothetical protein
MRALIIAYALGSIARGGYGCQRAARFLLVWLARYGVGELWAEAGMVA